MSPYIPQPGDPYSESVYPCCEHCADDPVHDVPKDGHTVDCTLCRPTVQDVLYAAAKDLRELGWAEAAALVEARADAGVTL